MDCFLENNTIWAYIPEPVLLKIFNLVKYQDVLRAGQTCQRWNEISTDDFLWRRLFHRDFKVDKKIGLKPGAESWLSEYKRLTYHTPFILTEIIEEHTHQVLHVSFSHNGKMFATCSKDGSVLIWNSSYPCRLKYSHDMKKFSWKYTQYSQFNQRDTLLLVSGIHFGSLHTTSGEIAVFTVVGNTSQLRCRIVNRPYDIFGTWFSDNYLLSGNLHWLAHLISSSHLWLNKANQEVDSEKVAITSQLYKFYNKNASSIRTILIANCPWLAAKKSEDEIDLPNECSYHDYNIEDHVDDTLSDDDLENFTPKYLIFSTGSKTYTPHQIGFKRIESVNFPKCIDPGLPIKDRIDLRKRELRNPEPDNPDWLNYDAVADKFDKIDKLIDIDGHIVGMCLSPDHKFLYVNSRSWPQNYIISNPLDPPPIAQEIDIHVIDLTTLQNVGVMRSHKAYTPNTNCFFIFLDVSNDYVASGAEDMHAYVWDRFYGICLAKYPHQDVVNSVAFNPQDPEMLITTSDDYNIKIWRSISKVNTLKTADIKRAVILGRR